MRSCFNWVFQYFVYKAIGYITYAYMVTAECIDFGRESWQFVWKVSYCNQEIAAAWFKLMTFYNFQFVLDSLIYQYEKTQPKHNYWITTNYPCLSPATHSESLVFKPTHARVPGQKTRALTNYPTNLPEYVIFLSKLWLMDEAMDFGF